MTKEYIQQWFDSSMEDRRKAKGDLKQFRDQFPYFNLADWMLSIIAEDPYAEWHTMQELSLIHPVMYVKELKSAEDFKVPEVEEVASSTQDITTGDYFFNETVKMPSDLHSIAASFKATTSEEERRPVNEDQSLMVVMTFSEWLQYLHEQSLKDAAEKESQRALKAMWQREKLAYAEDEEGEEIPEEVFNMALNSIRLDEEIVSESMAHVYMKQEKWSQAIEIYKKLSLRNPEKSSYFAEQIKELELKISL
ncbi:MAG TPA: hypothetical protein VFD78_01270 [Chitinophagaceae bacterium]|nr:hypothetical protein [Chitinophagaceae bacterium]